MQRVRVAVVDVSADADGHFGMQPGFASGISPAVGKDAIAVADDQVGDQLLVSRILLGRRAGKKEVVARIEKCRHVAVGVEVQPLKSSQPVENGAGHDQDVFHSFGHDGEPTGRRVFGHPENKTASACQPRRLN